MSEQEELPYEKEYEAREYLQDMKDEMVAQGNQEAEWWTFIDADIKYQEECEDKFTELGELL